MKKQLVVLFTLVAIALITFTSCEPFIENKITAKNHAAAGVILNLRGQEYNIPAGEILVLNDFKKDPLLIQQYIKFRLVLPMPALQVMYLDK